MTLFQTALKGVVAGLMIVSGGPLKAQRADSLTSVPLDKERPNVRATVWKQKEKNLVFFKADFDLDMDGSAHAYNSRDEGIDDAANARGGNRKWSRNVLVFRNDTPYVQPASAPYPGFFLSMTSLKLRAYADTDARRYLDPEKVPFVAMPSLPLAGYKFGDLVLVYNTRTKQRAFALFADASGNKIGEGSIALARMIGIPVRKDAKGKYRGGTDGAEIIYIVLPGTAPAGGYRKTEDVDSAGIQKKGNDLVRALSLKERLAEIIRYYEAAPGVQK